MKYSVDPDQLASYEASWSGSTLVSNEGIVVWKIYAYSALISLNYGKKISSIGPNKQTFSANAI